MLTDDMCMMMMPMTFTTSLPFQILFESWNVATAGDYAWSFVVVAIMGFCRQLFATLRHEVVAANVARGKRSGDEARLLDAVDGTAVVASWLRARMASPFLRRNQAVLRVLDVLLFGATLTASYLNMLVVMTFNPGMMMAVVVGEMIGFGTLQPLGGFALAAPAGPDAEEEGCCH